MIYSSSITYSSSLLLLMTMMLLLATMMLVILSLLMTMKVLVLVVMQLLILPLKKQLLLSIKTLKQWAPVLLLKNGDLTVVFLRDLHTVFVRKQKKLVRMTTWLRAQMRSAKTRLEKIMSTGFIMHVSSLIRMLTRSSFALRHAMRSFWRKQEKEREDDWL